MYSGFLHGIEIIETTIGPVPVTVVRSGVIGLVGTAPTFAMPTVPPWYTKPVGGVVPAWCVGDGANATWPLWNAKAAMLVGEIVIDSNANVQQCTAAGTTGTSAPTWATTLGSATTDAGATWKLVQLGAQLGTKNSLTLVSGSLDAAGFGPRIRGFTIPYALRAMQLQGAAQAIVVNVYSRHTHVTAVSAQAATFPGSGMQKIALGRMGVSGLVLTDSGGSTTYVLGTDYTVDQVNGVIFAKAGGALTTGEAVKATFNYANPADGTNGVADSDVIGAAGPPATGMQLLPYAFGQFGFYPKILIAPGFSMQQDVAVAQEAIAAKIRAVHVIDSPGGLAPIGGGASAPAVNKNTAAQTPTVSATLTSRGDTAKAFGSLATQRAILLFPNLMFTDDGVDPAGATVFNPTDGPYSAWYAGAMAANDIASGYWDSPSNIKLLGPLGPDVPMVMSAFDPLSDTNQLNAAGIATVYSSYATGLEAWGNRNAAYPGSTVPATFISIRRTLDVVEESLQYYSLRFLDRPISNALIQSILQDDNAFINLLVQRGALVPGSAVSFNPNENPPAQLAAGQVVFDVDLIPPPPLERLTYNFTVDITLLKNITGGAATPTA